MRTQEKTIELLRQLEQYDTPTVTNVVATYPNKKDECLGLYDPWLVDWYTDERIRCIYPQMGPKAGFAVTCVYGLPDDRFDRLGFADVLSAVRETGLPVVAVFKQDFPEKYRRKDGLLGGNMCTALKRAGCVGCVSDGPSRDIQEVRDIGIQLLLTGVTPGHGDFSVKAVNVPVTVCSMAVCPGEIVHMDENGACKFPADRLEEVVALCSRLVEKERVQMEEMRNCEDIVGSVSKTMKKDSV